MEELWGRKVLLTELSKEANLETAIELPTMKSLNALFIQCLRCGTVLKKTETYLTEGYYCFACIQLGRVDTMKKFYHLPEPEKQVRNIQFIWKGTLTAGQQEVSTYLNENVRSKQEQLLWAVTGAGKTEMLFNTIYDCLKNGERIGLASPRVDVCIELYPRLQAVFPEERIALLHGKMDEPYYYTKFVICTTHQLLRFYQAFDLLIIDEVDAFPFVNNAMLEYAVNQALKPMGSLVYLTATPTKALIKKIQQRQLAVKVLPARYHRRKLPVPQLKWWNHWQQKLVEGKEFFKICQLITSLLQENNVLIFCPTIQLVQLFKNHLVKQFPGVSIESIHAKDERRLEKVQKMRNQQIRILITSTILERGVTFDQVSVIILGANHKIFSTAALVQIAGRVDRKNVYTRGEVWFVYDGKTSEMVQAMKQIKHMNSQAKRRKLIDEM
ncbi:helicase-related protein [Melissococcus plutonius]|uniref:DEAD/DEAH box helicase n=2 Tax=Melissococcus plutonius TaxID=33970 RepID=UPI0021E54648|nr:helicase-related protein [Melissococcus plutonius]MCV2519033.1 DEAD/DEAH box helicase family protein [Melissococcus plutonius]